MFLGSPILHRGRTSPCWFLPVSCYSHPHKDCPVALDHAGRELVDRIVAGVLNLGVNRFHAPVLVGSLGGGQLNSKRIRDASALQCYTIGTGGGSL